MKMKSGALWQSANSLMSIQKRSHWLLGDPQSRRVNDYKNIAAHCGIDEPQCINWIDVINDGTNALESIDEGSRFRIDSFGQRAEVLTALIKHGGGSNFPSFGQILSMDHQHNGVCRVLETIEVWSANRPEIELDQRPSEIAVMFDKWATHLHLVSCEDLCSHRPATILLPLDVEEFWYELLSFARNYGGRVFVKPRFASSASGVGCFRICNGRHQLIAPLEIDRSFGTVKLFNSLHVRSYTSLRDIQDIYRILAPQGMIAEVAINKARVDGDRFDLRVVVINGRADHVVARKSSSPITNLHLGNARAPLSAVEEAVGSDRIQACRQLALRAAQSFPCTLYCGVDILVPQNGPPIVCEVNAFGDFIPNLMVDGRSVYQDILQAKVHSKRM